VKVSVYEVGPRDGLQSLKQFVDTPIKRNLIHSLYAAGIENIEETSMAHPKLVPQMADAEQVFQRGSVLIMNKRGYERACAMGAEKFNIVFSPCETFNMKNFGKTRSELILMYKTFMDKVPKENVRVYISMAFGSPYSGEISHNNMLSCIKDAKMFGNTIVLSDTIGCGDKEDVRLWAELGFIENVKLALHLHHKGDESKPISLVRAGLFAGIKEFDSSIGGLGGCPFVEGSGANLATETLVRHLHAWGFETGIDQTLLNEASLIAEEIKLSQTVHEIAA